MNRERTRRRFTKEFKQVDGGMANSPPARYQRAVDFTQRVRVIRAAALGGSWGGYGVRVRGGFRCAPPRGVVAERLGKSAVELPAAWRSGRDRLVEKSLEDAEDEVQELSPED